MNSFHEEEESLTNIWTQLFIHSLPISVYHFNYSLYFTVILNSEFHHTISIITIITFYFPWWILLPTMKIDKKNCSHPLAPQLRKTVKYIERWFVTWQSLDWQRVHMDWMHNRDFPNRDGKLAAFPSSTIIYSLWIPLLTHLHWYSSLPVVLFHSQSYKWGICVDSSPYVQCVDPIYAFLEHVHTPDTPECN